jgi:hypothetical protein
MYRILIKYNGNYEPLLIEGDGGLILEANDPLNYEVGKSSKTLSITILNNGKNNLLLGNLFNKSFDYAVQFNDTYLNLEDNVYLSGIIKINEITAESARGQFISTSFQLFDSLKSNKLGDYNYGLTHNVTAANQVLSESLGLLSGDVVYDFIDRGKTLFHQNSSESNPNQYANRVLVSERFPAVRVKKIIDTLLSGYTISGNHFTNTLFSDDQYLLFTKDNINITGNEADWDAKLHRLELKREFELDLDLNIISVGSFDDLIDTSSNFKVISDNPKDIYHEIPPPFAPGNFGIEIKQSGHYRLSMLFNGDYSALDLPTITNAKATIQLRKSFVFGSYTTFKTVEIPITEFYEYSTWDMNLFATTGSIYLEAGEFLNVTLRISGTIPTPQAQVRLAVRVKPQKSFLRITPVTAMAEGVSLDIAKIMPNIKSSEFLKSYLNEYNLQLFVNAETKVAIIYDSNQGTPTEVDITKEIIANTATISPANRVNYRFTKKISDGKVSMLAQYTDINREYVFDIGAIEEETFESPFSTTHEEACPRFGVTAIIPQIWSTYDTERPTTPPNISTNAGLRIVFLGGVENCNYIHEQMNGLTASPTRTTFRKLTPVTAAFDSNFDGDLFKDFHESNIRNLVYGHILECDMIVRGDMLRNLYYLQDGGDWRNVFRISVTGIAGKYRLISLRRKSENVYRAKFYKIIQ